MITITLLDTLAIPSQFSSVKKASGVLSSAEYCEDSFSTRQQKIWMAITAPWEEEEVVVDDDIGSRLGAPWKVVLYNDDIHTFDEVITQLQKALRCTEERAQNIAYEAHTRGKAIAYAGEFEDCFQVMGVLREIQLIVEIEG